jgi:hypothetical protein
MRADYRVILASVNFLTQRLPWERYSFIENMLRGYDDLSGRAGEWKDHIDHNPGHQVSPLADICSIIHEHSTVYELNLYIFFRHKSSRNGIHGPG